MRRLTNKIIDNKKLGVYYLMSSDSARNGRAMMTYVNDYINNCEHEIISIDHMLDHNKNMMCVITYLKK